VPEEIIIATEHAKYDVMAGARLNFIEIEWCRYAGGWKPRRTPW